MTTRNCASTIDRIAVKAIVVDGENVQHLIIGLNREDVESLLKGEVFTLPSGQVPVLTEGKSDIVLLFAERDGGSGPALSARTQAAIGTAIYFESIPIWKRLEKYPKWMPCYPCTAAKR